MVLPSADILEISVECQAVWIQIMFVGPDLGHNWLQRLSSDDTSKSRVYDNKFKQFREFTRNSESGIYIKLKEHQMFACLRYFADRLCQQRKPSSG